MCNTLCMNEFIVSNVPIGGHLGCFQNITITNTTAVIINFFFNWKRIITFVHKMFHLHGRFYRVTC